MPRAPDPYENRGQPRPPEEVQAVWRSLGWEQTSMFKPGTTDPIEGVPGPPPPEEHARMWTVRPTDEMNAQWIRQLDDIGHAVARLQAHPQQSLQEIGVQGIERLARDLSMLIRMNQRLVCCYGVAEGLISEGRAARYLGTDRTTFREIMGAAHTWAERIGGPAGGRPATMSTAVAKGEDGPTAQDDTEQQPAAPLAPGGGAGQPPQAGVPGP